MSASFESQPSKSTSGAIKLRHPPGGLCIAIIKSDNHSESLLECVSIVLVMFIPLYK